jgi:hypothetical protein
MIHGRVRPLWSTWILPGTKVFSKNSDKLKTGVVYRKSVLEGAGCGRAGEETRRVLDAITVHTS